MGLETEIIKYKQKLNDMALERDADKTKLQELVDENTQLQLTTKSFCNLSIDAPLSDEECASGDNSLSEQLTNNAQVRNRRKAQKCKLHSFLFFFRRLGRLSSNWRIVACNSLSTQ